MPSAGVVIKNGSLVLGGYHPKKQVISGIGGKSEFEESPAFTATRELIEELLGFSPSPLLTRLIEELFLDYDSFQNSSYTFFVLSFPQLEQILKLVQLSSVSSPFYSDFPQTIQDLVQKRIILPEDSPIQQEISYLYLLPLTPSLEIDPLFKQDLKIINKE
jgi:hypothetical protein